ncbi:hypothetical protein, partial [Staphylococcus epidermidis]|uniref:hypothetical protein n=1 Tax=Staphylococcus epidermidis TaxID=1282 RepID=UPI0005163BE0
AIKKLIINKLYFFRIKLNITKIIDANIYIHTHVTTKSNKRNIKPTITKKYINLKIKFRDLK